MSDRIKKIKIKQSDGTFSDYIPIGANAKDVDMANGYSLENTIGTIDVDKEGSIAKQLSKTTKYYDSVADMKADTQLTGGAAAVTLGYYKPNDGGGALYQIIDSTDEDYESLVDDGGSAHDLKNKLKAKLIMKKDSIYIKQFGAYGDGEHDDTNAIQSFLAFGKDRVTLFFTSGNYKITNSLEIDIRSNIILEGIVIIEDYIAIDGNSTIKIVKNEDGYTDGNDSRYVKSIIDNSNGCLTIYNRERAIEKTCIEIGNENYSFTTSIKGLNIRSYNVGILVHPTNVYICTFEDMVIFGCEEAFKIPNETLTNSGENIKFIKCTFTRNNCCIYNGSSMLLKFFHTSFDFNSCCFYIAYNNIIECNSCWFEGVGNRWESAMTKYNDFGGIAYSTDTKLSYQESKISIINSMICYLNDNDYPGYMFDGESLKVELDSDTIWYAEDQWGKVISNSAFDNTFLCSEKVRECIATNIIGRYGYAMPIIFPKKDNEVEAFFEQDFSEVTLNDLTNGETNFNKWVYYETEGATKSTKIKIEDVDGKKSLILTPPYNGATSVIRLKYKDLIPLKGKHWQMTSFVKGFKGSNLTYSTWGLEIYDVDKNLIKTINSIATNYRSDNIDGNVWFSNLKQNSNSRNTNEYNDLGIPKNSMYYKPFIDLNAIRGSQSSENQSNTNTQPTDPVYFTGFYCYNF